jgi:aminobenzoyl-glutamate utilization protein A
MSDTRTDGQHQGDGGAELLALRRTLHRYPEPAWCEFYTTARLIEQLSDLPVELRYGPEIHGESRWNVPESETLESWRDRASDHGADPAVLATLAEGYTGLVATLERGPGPTVALRVDVDGLAIEESTEEGHEPASEGFRSVHEGHMHACGHDGHMTIGVGVLRRIVDDDDFDGTLHVLFQPGEEQLVGGRSMGAGGCVEGVDALLALHLGLGHPTGTVVAGMEDFLASTKFSATFTGEAAHAAADPSGGANAIQAAATAVNNLHALPRDADSVTRVNVGRIEGGVATNIVAPSAFLKGEVRAGSTAAVEELFSRAERVLESAGRMHGVDVETTVLGNAPSASSDDATVDAVATAADRCEAVDTVHRRYSFGASEDATHLMRAVQDDGGVAAYVGVGTDHPAGHHTSTFDVDEPSIGIGVDVLTDAVRALASSPA